MKPDFVLMQYLSVAGYLLKQLFHLDICLFDSGRKLLYIIQHLLWLFCFHYNFLSVGHFDIFFHLIFMIILIKLQQVTQVYDKGRIRE